VENNSEQGSSNKFAKGCLWVVGIVIGLAVLGSIVSPSNEKSTSPLTETLDESNVSGDLDSAVNEAIENPSNTLTGPQRNAVRSAEQYLRMMGFSREGLIDQLSSEYGDGYQRADAIAAVDSLNVDWHEQAVRSARKYLDMMGFSCNGLIEQLSSDAGDQYSASEARYGAQQAGAC
jgi:hypothetical protein